MANGSITVQHLVVLRNTGSGRNKTIVKRVSTDALNDIKDVRNIGQLRTHGRNNHPGYINDVNCPRKGPMGNTISVIRCVEMWELTPASCVDCDCKVGSMVKESADRLKTYSEEYKKNGSGTPKSRHLTGHARGVRTQRDYGPFDI